MKRSLLVSLSVLLLILAGCNGNIESTTGTVTISIAMARSIQPNISLEAESFKLSAVKTDGSASVPETTLPAGSSSTTLQMNTGEWTFTVDAYNANGQKIATGSATETIISGDNSVSITVTEIQGEGTLTVTVEAESVNDALYALVYTKSIDGTEQIVKEKTLLTQNGTTYTTLFTLPNGSYFLNILDGDEKLKSMPESFRIVAGDSIEYKGTYDAASNSVTIKVTYSLLPLLTSSLELSSSVYFKSDTLNATVKMSEEGTYTYEWYLDGTLIEGLRGQTISYGIPFTTTAGTHELKVLVISQDGRCHDASASFEYSATAVNPAITDPDYNLYDVGYYINVGTSTLITLKDLDPLKLYSVYYSDSNGNLKSIKTSSKFQSSEFGALFSPEADGSFTFTGSDIGSSDDMTVRIRDISAGYQDMKIEEESDSYLTLTIDGTEQKIFEQYYLIPDIQSYLATKGLAADSVALMAVRGGSGYGGTNSGVRFDNDYGIDRHRALSLMDLAGVESLGLYNSMSVKNSSTPWTRELVLTSPVTLTQEVSKLTGEPTVYRVDSAAVTQGIEYLIEIIPGEGLTRSDYQIYADKAEARYTDGVHRKYLFPMNYSNDSILLYVGTVDDDFIFNFHLEGSVSSTLSDYGTIRLREIRPEEKNYLEVTITADNLPFCGEIPVTAGWQGILPLIVKAADSSLLTNLTIQAECTDEGCTGKDGISFVCVSASDFSYSRRGFALSETYEVSTGNKPLEYLYALVSNPSRSHNIKYTISR